MALSAAPLRRKRTTRGSLGHPLSGQQFIPTALTSLHIPYKKCHEVRLHAEKRLEFVQFPLRPTSPAATCRLKLPLSPQT